MARDVVMHLSLDEVVVRNGRRPINSEAVQSLAASIQKIGLQTPITCRAIGSGQFELIAGNHRLEAARLTGAEAIPAVIVKWDDKTARKWEISENLHRADLTELQRKEEIAEWIAITEDERRDAEKVSVQLAPKPQGGRPEGGISAAARELGVESTEAKRAVKIASISERAKQAAVDAKLDNNQAALLRIASVTPDEQVEKVREEAAERDRRRETRKPIPPSDAPRNDFEIINKDHRALVRAWEAARPEAREQFLTDIGAVIDVPVMDRGVA